MVRFTRRNEVIRERPQSQSSAFPPKKQQKQTNKKKQKKKKKKKKQLELCPKGTGKKLKRKLITPDAYGDGRMDRGNTVYPFHHSSNGVGIKTGEEPTRTKTFPSTYKDRRNATEEPL